MTGPVSTALWQEVSSEVRRQGLIIWLDKDASYSHFVDQLAEKSTSGEIPFPVVGFRGSFLELLFKLERYGSGLDKPQLLLHMPGFNEESIRGTPILELYEPGVRFRKNLDTLVREASAARVAPAEVTDFLATSPTLEAADEWLSGAVSRNAVGLEAILHEFGPRMLVEALAEAASLDSRVSSDDEVRTLHNYVHRLTGMDEAWQAFYPTEPKETGVPRLLHWLGGWLLAVEYVHDLRRLPHREELRRLRSLSPPLVKACGELLGQLRRDSGDVYARIADALEGFLADELRVMTPEDLGQVDTFREEENRVLAGAVEALRNGEWSKAKAWCEARQGDKSFWLQREQLRRSAWTLVGEAATFGEILARHPSPLEGVHGLDEATERYAAGAFEVDRAHRRFEQRRLALLDSRLPQHGALLEVTTALRRAHRTWADQLTRAFTALCKDQGFLPSASFQQRNLFEQVVHPLTLGGEKVAVFVIDAFRFEMATELVEELQGVGTSVDLKARLAELPTITSVGMNVLAPVASNGRLAVAGIFQGFKSKEFTVRTPGDRARAMGLRSAGKPALLLDLAEVCEAKTASLKREVAQHSLVVVHSKEIDDAGEANVGLPTFESSLRLIKAAWHSLQLAGIKSFVFTADHGFLLRDETTSESKDFGTPRDPKRRHVFDEYPRVESGLVNVSLSSLGYDGLTGYLLFRDDTAVFTTGTPGASFVHGGNSLQERLIPVLTVTRMRAEQLGNTKYELEVESMADAFGYHRLKLRLDFAKDTTGTLGFAGARTVDVALRVPKRDEIRAIIREVSGAGQHKAGRLQLPVGDVWTEVFFSLEGPADDRARIEVHHPDKIEKVEPRTLDTWFSVSGTGVQASPPPQASAGTWADSIEDPAIRAVFEHIERHGVVTEPEATRLLGSPRAFRRFSAVVEVYLPRLPYRLRTESTDSGKRYVREGDR